MASLTLIDDAIATLRRAAVQQGSERQPHALIAAQADTVEQMAKANEQLRIQSTLDIESMHGLLERVQAAEQRIERAESMLATIQRACDMAVRYRADGCVEASAIQAILADDSGPADEPDHQGSGADHGGRAGSSANEGSIPSAVSPLHWTPGPPTEAGWYWWRMDGVDAAAGGCIWVDVEPGDNGETSVVCPMAHKRERVLCASCHGWEWAGPIPEPTDD